MLDRSGLRARLLAGIVSAVAFGCATASADDYLLAPGDVIRMSILGTVMLDRDSTISPSGTASFPMIGSVAAEGRTIAALNAEIGEALTGRAVRMRDSSGAEVWRVLRADEILVDIVEYRPIFVNGDVSSPGELPFRPGMTVRQALASSGGVVELDVSEEAAEFAVLDLRAQREVLEREIANQIVLLDVLERRAAAIAEVARRNGASTKSDLGRAASDPRMSALARAAEESATAELAALLDDVRQSDRFLAERTSRLDILRRQNEAEQEGMEFDKRELSRLEDLASRGTVARNVVSEARRDLLFSATRELQTSAEIARLQTEFAEFAARAERGITDARTAALAEIAERTAELGVLRSRLEANDRRLAALLGVSREVEATREIVVSIVRGAGPSAVEIAATFETLLLPGDVVEVQAVERLETTP